MGPVRLNKFSKIGNVVRLAQLMQCPLGGTGCDPH
jgi:hypothetical protein